MRITAHHLTTALDKSPITALHNITSSQQTFGPQPIPTKSHVCDMPKKNPLGAQHENASISWWTDGEYPKEGLSRTPSSWNSCKSSLIEKIPVSIPEKVDEQRVQEKSKASN